MTIKAIIKRTTDKGIIEVVREFSVLTDNEARIEQAKNPSKMLWYVTENEVNSLKQGRICYADSIYEFAGSQRRNVRDDCLYSLVID